eukprot:gene6281-6760_t
MKSLNKYSLNVKQDPLSFQGSVQTEISRRSSNSSTERIEEVFSFNTNQKTIVDYERQLMQQRTELFMQVWRNPLLYQEFIEFMTFSKSPIFIGVLNGLQTLFIFLPVLTFQIKNNYSSRITSILVVIEIIVGISAALSVMVSMEYSIRLEANNWASSIDYLRLRCFTTWYCID